MRRFRTNSFGIEQGSRVLFSDFIDDGVMWTGQGPRESRHIVQFREAFIDVPAVHVSIAMWDMDSGANGRADIAADKVTAKGFHLVFKTWGDTRVARIRADWMAIGPLRDTDEWEVD
ncbi:H-type lectin domain-containing protein [Szabonella alba]|uniref:H-type lectin domain-containing protein n=1 Tax=Szabonella alba TaxID=2804194 RepID=A0A8K0Y288_9RHOB|nr:H-type lectin domain-containing protein [Szabonella alba]MBL4918932.1 H-type lectin domain-containing protein [Szabonella alba]